MCVTYLLSLAKIADFQRSTTHRRVAAYVRRTRGARGAHHRPAIGQLARKMRPRAFEKAMIDEEAAA